MACKPDENFEIIDNQQTLDNTIAFLKDKDLLAVKCEVGVNRKKDISFIMIGTEEKAYIFDVLTMGKTVFTSGLQSILESKSQEKLMFDCREQSDALWHQFQIKISGVLDIQLLEVMYRREKSANTKPAAKHIKRSHRPEEVECVYGFYHCMELYVKDVLFEGKDEEEKIHNLKFRNFVLGTAQVFKTRPIMVDVIKILSFSTKVAGLFTLYEKMKEILNSEEKDRLLIASERYADFYRTRKERSFDNYEANTSKDINLSQIGITEEDLSLFWIDVKSFDGFTDAYLPLDIIPEKGTTNFAEATHVCTTCKRKFPRQEFSNTQLRNGDQKCRVCKEIKRRIDVESNREEREERNAWFGWRRRRYSDLVVDLPPCGNDHCFHYGCRCGDGDEDDYYY